MLAFSTPELTSSLVVVAPLAFAALLRYKGGPFLVVKKFKAVTVDSLRSHEAKTRAARATSRGDVSALFAPRWFEQLGRGVLGVLNTIHHPSTNVVKEPLWEGTWVSTARQDQVEVAVSSPVGTPMVEACAKLADKALFDGRLTLAQDLLSKCHHFHPASPQLLATRGNLAFMQGNHGRAGRLWDVAARRLFLSGQHDAWRKDLEARVVEVQAQELIKSDATSPAALAQSHARAALEAYRVAPSEVEGVAPLVFM